jgi:ribonucleoside-diphosphate reductase alpha chain
MGDNAIHYLGHVKMMAAVQPYLSGAISKTVNMPEDATVEDVEQLHIDAWKMGLKAVAIYRDNCKVAQPLSMAKKEGSEKEPETSVVANEPAVQMANNRIVVKGAVRRLLPRRRNSKTYKFHIADLKGFLTVGEYEDGTPGELFISVSKQGSTLSGLMDSFAIAVSHGLQYGVPLKSYVRTLMNTGFSPSGITDDEEIRTASSITDYICRRLALDYLSFDDRLELGLASLDDMPVQQTTLLTDDRSAASQLITASEELPQQSNIAQEEAINRELAKEKSLNPPEEAEERSVEIIRDTKTTTKDSTAPLCYNCGNQTQRSGSCYVCTSCGSTTGCS